MTASTAALIGIPIAVLTAITTWAHGWGLVIAVVVATVLATLAVLLFLWVFSGRGEAVTAPTCTTYALLVGSRPGCLSAAVIARRRS